MSVSVDIHKSFPHFNLDVQFCAVDEVLALLGASGCGKSVTLRCIAGILRPDEGHIELDGRVLFDSAAKIDLPPQKRGVGYLFQQYALFPNMTVRQNIAVAVRNRKERDSVAEEKLRQFRLMDVADRRPRFLSGGQQQRAALARILSSDPDMILLDEPFSALDSYLKYQLELELMDMLAGFPGTVLWVTHDRGEAWRNCRRVCVIDGGRSESVMTMQNLFHHPGTEPAARLSGCKNYVSAIPQGDAVQIPGWHLLLHCGQTVPEDVVTVGIRSHHVRPSDGTEANQIPCLIDRVIDDVFESIVMLRPVDSETGAPLLRMQLPKEVWAARPKQNDLTVTVAPRDILLLR